MADSELTAYPTRVKAPTEVWNAEVSLAGKLKPNEVLTGTPTVSASGLTLSAAAVSTKPLVINGDQVETGKAVLFTVSGGTAATDYVITVTATTSTSQTLVVYCRVNVRTS